MHAPLYRLRYWNNLNGSSTSIFLESLHAPLYRLRYWNSIKLSNLSLQKERYCMHPYTVYGIETTWYILLSNIKILYCMHPYTVYGIETAALAARTPNCSSDCMHPYTVYGIETNGFYGNAAANIIACTLIPFTVLKLTTVWYFYLHFQLHAPLYRLRYWNNNLPASAPFFSHIACTLIPFTVLKLWAEGFHPRLHSSIIACTLIPFTVLKPTIAVATAVFRISHCMHPYTVYGIETKYKTLQLSGP